MKTTPQLWTDMTEEEFQEERKRIRRDQAAHTNEKGNEEKQQK